ncbi:hypothetical protein SADUNF_Sadunf07G0116300 [Salix dunnii]|uniref:Uncharacterized protein n=1 Tax=Salix dunnii TaxID=1413687 RepID=A0A835K284_9ROSI|nr:hypothetical protein SADUNF_Sadunf07G0116300 [Salix dunnii]
MWSERSEMDIKLQQIERESTHITAQQEQTTHLEITLKNLTLRMVFFLSKRKGADFKHLLDEALSKCHQVDNFPSFEDFLAGMFLILCVIFLNVKSLNNDKECNWTRLSKLCAVGIQQVNWHACRFPFAITLKSSEIDYTLVIDDKFLMAEEFMHGVGPMLSVRGESILSWIGGGDFVVEDATTSTHEIGYIMLRVTWFIGQSCPGSSTSRSQEFDQLQTTGSEASSSHGPGRKPTQSEATLTISEESAFQDFSEKNKAVNQNAKVFVTGLTIGNSDPFSLIQGSDVKGNLHRNQLPTFEAEAAESKLDMLLGLLSETKLLDSSGFGCAKSSYTVATPDNILDDLFEETSNLKEKEAATPLPLLARNALALQNNTSTAATPDDVLDLLEEASHLSNQNNLHQPLEMNGASYQI